MSSQKPLKRMIELDGLRGMASVSVFLSHAIGMVVLSGTYLSFNNSIIHIFWDGAAAVILFFVLSGFVLALPYLGERSKRMNYISFLIRRFFRIYPAYVVAIIFSVLLKKYLYDHENLQGLSPWIVAFWNESSTELIEIIKHFIMVGIDNREINPVVWTLVIEMKVSIVFPLYIFIIQKLNNYKLLILISITISFVTFLLGGFFLYLPFFILGGLLAKYHKNVINILRNKNRSISIIVFILSILLYSNRYSFFGIITNDFITNLLIGIGTVFLIVTICVSERFSRLLSSKSIRFLGDISYGFYLLHFPLLLVVTSLLYPKNYPLLFIWAFSFMLSVALSYIMLKYIEMPFQRIGMKISTKFRKDNIRQSKELTINRYLKE